MRRRGVAAGAAIFEGNGARGAQFFFLVLGARARKLVFGLRPKTQAFGAGANTLKARGARKVCAAESRAHQTATALCAETPDAVLVRSAGIADEAIRRATNAPLSRRDAGKAKGAVFNALAERRTPRPFA